MTILIVMKTSKSDTSVWIVIGALTAVLLGAALIPLRELTSASNLAFAFVILTIVVAEIGGRTAALVTAMVSGVSLNFFLTQPYLTLNIDKREDLIAFGALVFSGLIAAAFGKKRAQWSAVAKQAGARMEFLSRFVNHLRKDKSLEETLSELQRQFQLGAIALRDENEKVLAAVPRDFLPVIPKTELNPVTLFASESETTHRYGSHGFRFPEEGGRLSFHLDRGAIRFDLWEGDPRGLDLEMRQTLAIAALLMVLQLSSRAKPAMLAS